MTTQFQHHLAVFENDAWKFVKRVAFEPIGDADASERTILDQLTAEAKGLHEAYSADLVRSRVDEWDLLAADLASFLRNRRNQDGSITLTKSEVARLAGLLGHPL